MRRYFYPGCLMVEVEAVKHHTWLRNGGPNTEGLPDGVHFALAVLSLLLRWCTDV